MQAPNKGFTYTGIAAKCDEVGIVKTYSGLGRNVKEDATRQAPNTSKAALIVARLCAAAANTRATDNIDVMFVNALELRSTHASPRYYFSPLR